MTANLLTLNTSKTEFLLIGLKQQLAKIQNCTLYTTHSARNLGFIFDEHLTFSDQISLQNSVLYPTLKSATPPLYKGKARGQWDFDILLIQLLIFLRLGLYLSCKLKSATNIYVAKHTAHVKN